MVMDPRDTGAEDRKRKRTVAQAKGKTTSGADLNIPSSLQNIIENDDDLMMETDYSVMDSDDLDTDSDATEVPAKRVSLTTPDLTSIDKSPVPGMPSSPNAGFAQLAPFRVNTPHKDTNQSKISTHRKLTIEELWEQVLLPYLLVRDSVIYPYYQPCVSDPEWVPDPVDGPLRGSKGDLVDAERPDELSLLLVNRKFNGIGSPIFYGTNTFKFSNPERLRYFIQNIGDSNLALIRRASLELHSGFVLWACARQTFDLCAERRWYGVLVLLRRKHQLDYLRVDFQKWTEIDLSTQHQEVTIDEKRIMMRFRHLVVEEMKSYRGIRHASIVGGVYLGQRGGHSLGLLMGQRKVMESLERRPFVPLEESFSRCRLEGQVAKPWSDPQVVIGLKKLYAGW